ncbi:MAG: HPr family phosphocarrier protein [Lachnospiraceae bacterium]|nr:HPr family phosphocarrier protein [Lachnospiraceae bacterium]
MVSKAFTIKNKTGLHMRTANAFVTAVSKFDSDVNIVFNGKTINGKSIMNVMAACIKCGHEITVECSGSDENAALEAAAALIEDGFGEE